MSATMPRTGRKGEGNARRVSYRSAPIRELAIRTECARFYRTHFNRPSKVYGIGKNKITMAKQSGGALADLLLQMEKAPEAAQPIAQRVQSHADSVTRVQPICV